VDKKLVGLKMNVISAEFSVVRASESVLQFDGQNADPLPVWRGLCRALCRVGRPVGLVGTYLIEKLKIKKKTVKHPFLKALAGVHGNGHADVLVGPATEFLRQKLPLQQRRGAASLQTTLWANWIHARNVPPKLGHCELWRALSHRNEHRLQVLVVPGHYFRLQNFGLGHGWL
jgi:hypothetical protein